MSRYPNQNKKKTSNDEYLVVLLDLEDNTCACAVPLNRSVDDNELTAKLKKKKQHDFEIIPNTEMSKIGG